ncbi:MAG: Mrp/NBP35 family ATP-binding protein [Bosea sp.]|uniref:P-loop NTPase n=1 Tax=Bosea sp. (in: a-proteobacteria) TaxID=1871050 RepID=UPI0023A0150D|nr:Mrp/NBP35 family ATP-binding protein [Bosea sp. (in: a-proteobacteria)]
MSEFVAPDGSRHALFGSGGGAALATDVGVPLLGTVPIEPGISEGADIGEPAVLGSGPAADALRGIAQAIAEEHIPPVEMAGCSARMLDAAVAALDAMDAESAADSALQNTDESGISDNDVA